MGEQDEESVVHEERIGALSLEIELESTAESASRAEESEANQAKVSEVSLADEESVNDALMSAEEIEALLAAASNEVTPTEESSLRTVAPKPAAESAPAGSRVRPSASAGDSATLSEEEIAALMESAIQLDNSPPKIELSSPSQSDLTANETSNSYPSTGDPQEGSESPDEPDIYDQEEEIELTEAELAMLVRQTIDDQAESLDAANADGGEDLAESPAGKEVVGAEKLSALLEEPDPDTEDGGPVPSESRAMDPDELAALMSEASEIASQGGSVDPGQPLTAGFEPSVTGETDTKKAQPVSVASLTPKSVEFNKAAVNLVPASLAIRALALPIGFEGNSVVCKVAEPVDSAALDFLAAAIGQSVKPQPAPIEEVVTGLREAYSQVFVKQARVAVTGPKKKVRIVGGIANIFKRSA